MTTKQPSPGALRAAEEIKKYLAVKGFSPAFNTPQQNTELANIIDRETGASDLLAALELLYDDLDNNGEILKTDEKRLEIIKSAITKAEGADKGSTKGESQ